MTYTLKQSFLIVSFILFFSVLLRAQQNNCSEKLRHAQELFESGQIEQIPFLLDSCIKSGFSEDQRIKAYRLLIQTYLFDSNIEMADTIMLKLLAQNPDYVKEASDPVEFVELLNKFNVLPDWSIGISIGPNISEVRVSENYSLSNINKLSSTYTPNGLGFNGGVYANKYLNKDLWVSAALNFSNLKFRNNQTLGYGTQEVVYKENSDWFTLPLTLNRSFFTNTINPFIQLGLEFDYLSEASADINRFTLVNNNLASTQLTAMNLAGYRNAFNMSMLGGVGVTFHRGFNLLQFMIGYRYCLLPYVNGNERYSNPNLIYYYQHIDDNFNINNLYFSVGYSYLFHKIRKNQFNELSK